MVRRGELGALWISCQFVLGRHIALYGSDIVSLSLPHVFPANVFSTLFLSCLGAYFSRGLVKRKHWNERESKYLRFLVGGN